MKYRFFLMSMLALMTSCKKSDTNQVLATVGPTSMDIAMKLKQWSMAQPQPFVVCARGNTSQGKLNDNGELVTNIVFVPIATRWELRDSLLIDSNVGGYFGNGRSAEQLKSLFDSLSMSFTEAQMSAFLMNYGLKLRMMNYDSLTNTLENKLLQWARHQYPPKVMWSGFYSFVNEGPNAGGYSDVWFSYRGVQNLQYFTRSVSTVALQTIVSSVDTSLTFDQLRNVLLPIAPIQIHDTSWGPE